MENIYLVFVIILFILAISDLVVGVGNDAVNFLNSAIGAKVAPFRVILGIAGLGVLVGATFSGGMMEIARSGVFHPDQFYFNEIMVIFLAVMITDIILLDTFNTFGLPTSTTVSIIFELLGAAVAVSLFKMYSSPDSVQYLSNYINSGKALAIISGILLSVVIAFTVGTVVQFISRLAFTFNYERNLRWFGALWGGMAVTSIVYFILVKGASGASFMTGNMVAWINENTIMLLLYCFAGFTVLGQILISFFRVNIFRFIVLIGTFSLAMAFAGNDLVNFIGVPLAGYDSYRLFIADPTIDPSTMTMGSLLEPVRTPTGFLLAAGIIMVLALFFSKKARSVTKTEVDLARQSEGAERFPSSLFARTLVRKAIDTGKFFRRIMPGKLLRVMDSRFDMSLYKRRKRIKKDTASFDQLRASVNLFVASILIALATSLKLPLSTTYVTFMVAMGTSFSDGAWGRESAVYRITGVITVIGGWFFTAFTAFTVAFLFALFISWGGLPATIAAMIMAVIFVIRTYYIHSKRSLKEKSAEEKEEAVKNGQDVFKECSENIQGTVQSVSKLYYAVNQCLIDEDRKKLKKVMKRIVELNDQTKKLKNELYRTLRRLEEDDIDTGHYYVQTLDYLRELSHCLSFIASPVYDHLDNNHPPLIPSQAKEIKLLNGEIAALYTDINKILKSNRFEELDPVIKMQAGILAKLEIIKKRQIKLIKSEEIGTKNSMLVLGLLAETKNLLLYTVNMVKAHRDFAKTNNIHNTAGSTPSSEL
ncbi:MAG: phosphate permease [Marinilabiliales bacterium]|nr:MAG: phosphate permease [Marinilabiliales bacterium]